jgi:hypothetical protein
MATDLLDGQLGNILNLIAAAGGLGTAAMGLVDASKALWGGPSRFGFGFIRAAVERFLPMTSDGPNAFSRDDILRTLQANWINGVPEADQKAKAKALIHLRLTRGDAPTLAALAGVDPATLQSVASKAVDGEQVTPQEIAVLGQFDAVLSAVLDEAYERGDQRYRNAAKLLAIIAATLLAIFGGWLIYYDAPSAACASAAGGSPPSCPPPVPVGDVHWWSYFGTRDFFVALLVGVGAAPVAPVAKDLASSLQAAVTAVGAARRLAR